MLLTSISCLGCPSTGCIVSLSKLLANITAVVVTLIQSDHPADTGFLSHSLAHPSFRPLLCISPSLFAGRWLRITDVGLREPLHCIHLALPKHPTRDEPNCGGSEDHPFSQQEGTMFVYVRYRGREGVGSKSACFGLGTNQEILRITRYASTVSWKHEHL